MRYLCLNCEERFDHEGAKLRCPKCLRVTGLEKIESAEAKTAEAAKNPYLVPGAIVLALALAMGGYAVWRSSAPEQVTDEIHLEPLTPGTLEAHFRRLHVEPGDLSTLLASNDAIEGFATRAAADRDGAVAIAEGVQAALRAKASSRAFVRWSLGVPREDAPMTAADAYEAMREDGAEMRLYPIEVAAIAVSALRTRGVNAMLTEIYKFPGDQSPPDPSGQMGYYGVAVYEGEAGEGEVHIFDPWGGHETSPEEADYNVLNDVEAVGAVLNVRALHLLVRENNPERALEVSSRATTLCPRSPAVRAVRGAILLVAGNPNEALAELESAQQIRADGPRRNLIAGLYMAREDVEAAQREASAALEEFPQFAHAHATLAAIHMASAEPDLALNELEAAEQADPNLYILPALRANYYAMQGNLERAVAEIAHAVELNPDDFNTRLTAAQIYRQAGRYDAMRREAQAVLLLVPEGRRDQLRAALAQRLGESAFEDPMADDDLTEEEIEAANSGEDFTLQAPSIDGVAPTGDEEEELTDEEIEAANSEAEGADGPVLMLGDRNHFSLGGGGGGGGGLTLQ